MKAVLPSLLWTSSHCFKIDPMEQTNMTQRPGPVHPPKGSNAIRGGTNRYGALHGNQSEWSSLREEAKLIDPMDQTNMTLRPGPMHPPKGSNAIRGGTNRIRGGTNRYGALHGNQSEWSSLREEAKLIDAMVQTNITLRPGPMHPPKGSNAIRGGTNRYGALHGNQSEWSSLREEAEWEMVATPCKTPVSVLQELLSRHGITPKYELVQMEGVSHEMIFRYRVFLCPELIATGTGRSKKEAKHATAKNLLDLIVGKEIPEQANQTKGTPGAADITNQVLSPYDDKVMGNPIGRLQEMCMSRGWPAPVYYIEHEEGLPHERQFAIACKIQRFTTVGSGKSKKLAKRMAAHKMWQSLQDLPLDSFE